MSHKRALTLNSNGGLLRALISDVGVSLPFVGDQTIQSNLKIENFKGIWDTGATGTVVTKKVIDILGLKVTGQTEVYTAQGKYTTNTYLVNIYPPMNYVVQWLTVTEGKLPPHADLLIGMDIITTGDFSITHPNGKTKMSFGCPSCESVDYFERYIRDNPVNKIGRNDKCSCNSGKKYKNCCGK